MDVFHSTSVWAGIFSTLSVQSVSDTSLGVCVPFQLIWAYGGSLHANGISVLNCHAGGKSRFFSPVQKVNTVLGGDARF